MAGMRAADAIGVLQSLGCGSDPIVYKGKELDVDALLGELNWETRGEEFSVTAASVKLTYYKNPKEKYKQSSLLAMTKDRFNAAAAGRL